MAAQPQASCTLVREETVMTGVASGRQTLLKVTVLPARPSRLV